jgi:hypothetical protein
LLEEIPQKKSGELSHQLPKQFKLSRITADG